MFCGTTVQFVAFFSLYWSSLLCCLLSPFEVFNLAHPPPWVSFLHVWHTPHTFEGPADCEHFPFREGHETRFSRTSSCLVRRVFTVCTETWAQVYWVLRLARCLFYILWWFSPALETILRHFGQKRKGCTCSNHQTGCLPFAFRGVKSQFKLINFDVTLSWKKRKALLCTSCTSVSSLPLVDRKHNFRPRCLLNLQRRKAFLFVCLTA